MSESDNSTPEDDTRSLRERILGMARALRDVPEPTRRHRVFLLMLERLRHDWHGEPDTPPCTVTEVIGAAYDDPHDYWARWVDLQPERIGVRLERFLAVHAATRYNQVRAAEATAQTDPAVRRLLLEPAEAPLRERLRALMRDPDFGYLIAPELATFLERGEVTPGAPTPLEADKAQDDLTTERPELLRISEPQEVVFDLTTEPPKLPRYKKTKEFPQADPSQRDACIRALAKMAGGKTGRPHVRRWGRLWLRQALKLDAPTSALEEQLKGSAYRDLRRDGGRPKN
jgi:hypothetical protein